MNRIIMDELVCGGFKPEAVAWFQGAIGRLGAAGCDAVVLGCTEIPLIVNEDDSPLPTLDSTRLLGMLAASDSVAGLRNFAAIGGSLKTPTVGFSAMTPSTKVTIRDAAPGDELEVARIHVLSWQVAYRGLLPDAYLDGLHPEDRARRYTFARRDPDRPQTIIALEDRDLRGFATVAPVHDPSPRAQGELCALYVDPNHWGEGWGAALVGAARARLSSLGFDTAVLWMLVGNTRAGRFYERDGWRTDGGRRADRVWELTVEETRFRRALP